MPLILTNQLYISMQQIQGRTTHNTAIHDNLAILQLQSVHELCEVKQIINDVKYSQNPTIEGNQESQMMVVESLSKKKLRRKLQISFEKYFLKEHSAVFHQTYQNYIESIKLINDNQQIQSAPTTIFESKPHYRVNEAVKLMKANQNKLTISQKEQYFKDLQHEEQLREFLDIVVEYCSTQLSMGLLEIAYYVWMKYVPNQHRDVKLSWLIQFGEEIGRQAIGNHCIKRWSFEMKKEHYQEQSFIEFIQIYCVTILFIVSDYFQNPYYQSSQKITPEKKRTFNELILSDSDDLSELQSSAICRKFRKGV